MCHMRIETPVVPGTRRLSKIADLSREAAKRVKWFDYYYGHGCNARLTCRHFDISPQTFYRWKVRYNPKDLTTLEGKSHHPKNVRRPEYSAELVAAVIRIREAHPRWGKDKLRVLLEREGQYTSASTVGRILTHAK